MTREEKIEMLAALASGKPLEVTEITLIEDCPTHTYVMHESIREWKHIPNQQVQDYMVKFKKENPFKRVVFTLIDREEYERFSAKFEVEY